MPALLRTAEVGSILKGLLIDTGFSPSSLANVGAHSCKATALSWSAKAGVPRDDRRALGYHLKPGDRWLESYSRDSMAQPLRALEKVLDDVRDGRFRPDETRSGYVAPASSTRSSAASSASSMAGSDVAELTALTEEKDNARLVLNVRTGYLRVLDGGALACGKCIPEKKRLLNDIPAEPKFCSRCF